MGWNPQTLQFLSQCFVDTLSLLPEARRRAESNLAEAADSPNYGIAVLRLVAEPSVDDQIRLAAAVHFKNHLRTRWAPTAPTTSSSIPVPEKDQITSSSIPGPEKDQIKTLIVSLMLSAAASPRIQSQLSEALALIGRHDFPDHWPTLLPELCSNLDVASKALDYSSVNGILATLNSLFKKFRYEFKTAKLVVELEYCVDHFAQPLWEVFDWTVGKIKSAVRSGGAADNIRPLIESQRLCCRIFYSLNIQHIPQVFEDNMDKWMPEFKEILTAKYPDLEDGGGDGLTLVDGLRAAVCENISHYMKEEELLQKYLSGFVEAVWSLLVVASASATRERLTVTAIKFLTTVSKSIHHTLFARDDILQLIFLSVVIPNVMLRDEDEELFDMNYGEFIRRDMEGCDLDTRRRSACELLKGIAKNNKEKIAERVSSQINSCRAPAANWKHKDSAIYLIVSLATEKAGGSLVSTDLVENLFGSVIVPELRSQDVNGCPMLKAGALKFFTMFRIQISKPVALALFPDVVRFLGSDSNVVHSYAASCIEKLLLVKDEGVRARYTSADISPFLLVLMTNLFSVLEKPESEENQYVMKCIMRVLGVAEISTEVASPCIAGLTSVLSRVCENPKNPIFNHYLFEAVAVLLRRACEKNPSLVPAFESSLFPSLQMILAKDVTEFFPYVFQLLAQLVELNRPPIPPHYMQIVEILLLLETWKKSANVPPLVRLLQSFLQKLAPPELNRERRLTRVLEIFGKLVSSPSTDEQGFYVLNTVIENLGYDVIEPYMSRVWALLFTRLQNSRSAVKFVKHLVISMSLFLVKHGLQHLVDSVNAIQDNILPQILEKFWVPNLRLITGSIEIKLTSVASTRLICEYPILLDDPATAGRLWGKMADSIITLLTRPEEDRVKEEPEEVPDIETVGYNDTFIHLHNAGKKEEEDPLKEINDPKHFFVASLANLSAHSPGWYHHIISENLEPANQAAFLQLCNSY